MPVSAGRLTLQYPQWIPGDHSPSGPVAMLAGLTLTANGKPLPWRRAVPGRPPAASVTLPAGWPRWRPPAATAPPPPSAGAHSWNGKFRRADLQRADGRLAAVGLRGPDPVLGPGARWRTPPTTPAGRWCGWRWMPSCAR
ncbi:hypothetical protein [Pantoea ananatis]|uniref:M61 family metallopeptidase n=1 Tax=Pantoea ananas TaxID=553 RepID=UPI0039B86323